MVRQLDVDIIPQTNSTNVENINFVSQPPSGTYNVCVKNFRQTGNADEYTLEEAYQRNKKKMSTKTTTLYQDQRCKDYGYNQEHPTLSEEEKEKMIL